MAKKEKYCHLICPRRADSTTKLGFTKFYAQGLKTPREDKEGINKMVKKENHPNEVMEGGESVKCGVQTTSWYLVFVIRGGGRERDEDRDRVGGSKWEVGSWDMEKEIFHSAYGKLPKTRRKIIEACSCFSCLFWYSIWWFGNFFFFIIYVSRLCLAVRKECCWQRWENVHNRGLGVGVKREEDKWIIGVSNGFGLGVNYRKVKN